MAEVQPIREDKGRIIGQASIEAVALYKLLKAVPVGESIGYKVLCDEIGVDVQKEGRGVLTTARKMCLRIDEIHFGVEENVGLRHLTPSEVARLGPQFAAKHRRMAGRQRMVLQRGVKDFESLSLEDKISQQTGLTVLHFIGNVTGSKGMVKIGAGVESAGKMLPLAKTLELFKK